MRADLRGRAYRVYRAQVGFWRVAARDGVRYFSRMRLRYWHGGQRDYVYRWAVLPGATSPAGTAGLQA